MRRKVTIISYQCKCGLKFKSIYGNSEIFTNSQHCYYRDLEFKNIIYNEVYKKNQSILVVANKLNINPIKIELYLHGSFEEEEEEINPSSIKRYRKEWKEFVNNNKEKHFIELKYNLLSIYTWLYRNDNSWLIDSLEILKNNYISPTFLRKRDNFLKEYIRSELHRLIFNQYRGSKISTQLCFPFLVRYIYKELPYFPKTSKYIERIRFISQKQHEKRLNEIMMGSE